MVEENDGNLVVVKEEGKQYNCVGVGGGKTKYENQVRGKTSTLQLVPVLISTSICYLVGVTLICDTKLLSIEHVSGPLLFLIALCLFVTLNA